jgi:hypothetical protein
MPENTSCVPVFVPRAWRLTTIVAVGMLAGCVHTARVRTTPDHRFIPEGLGRSLPAQGQQGKPRIRYDGIYVEELPGPHGGPDYDWYRFWPDGRVLWRGSQERRPTAGDADDFAGGNVGRYCVSDGGLTIELYTLVDERWQFITYTGRLREDGGFTLSKVQYHDDWRFWLPQSSTFTSKYDFKLVGQMFRTPDW